MRKYSRQRENILNSLRAVKSHPTASELYTIVQKNIPNISLGTVYRNLALLANDGDIQRITTGEGTERFDGDIRPHYHLCCTACGKVIDLPLPSMEELNKLAERSCGCKIISHSLIYYGECKECCELGDLSEKIQSEYGEYESNGIYF